MPQFLKKFSVDNSLLNQKFQHILRPDNKNSLNFKRSNKTLLLQSYETSKNQYKLSDKSDYKLVLVKL